CTEPFPGMKRYHTTPGRRPTTLYELQDLRAVLRRPHTPATGASDDDRHSGPISEATRRRLYPSIDGAAGALQRGQPPAPGVSGGARVAARLAARRRRCNRL